MGHVTFHVEYSFTETLATYVTAGREGCCGLYGSDQGTKLKTAPALTPSAQQPQTGRRVDPQHEKGEGTPMAT